MEGFPSLHVSSHPAVLHKLALLRNEKTEPKKFRELVREISWLVGYEALADARWRAPPRNVGGICGRLSPVSISRKTFGKISPCSTTPTGTPTGGRA